MSKYTVVLSKKAQKKLDKLTDSIAAPIFVAIEGLADNPRPFGYKKLKGSSGYRIRVAEYRIIYEIYDDVLIVDVIDLGHRKDIFE